ncbi:hypothetical protein DFO69_0708 [Bacillus subtilis]|nr:hypothetical protein DFO69_0708 [Bacillus subtilis]
MEGEVVSEPPIVLDLSALQQPYTIFRIEDQLIIEFFDNVRFPKGNLFFNFSLLHRIFSCNKGLFH